MFPVEPLSFRCTDEKLAFIGIWTGVGHAQDAGPDVLQFEAFILERTAVNALTPGTVHSGEITT